MGGFGFVDFISEEALEADDVPPGTKKFLLGFSHSKITLGGKVYIMFAQPDSQYCSNCCSINEWDDKEADESEKKIMDWYEYNMEDDAELM